MDPYNWEQLGLERGKKFLCLKSVRGTRTQWIVFCCFVFEHENNGFPTGVQLRCVRKTKSKLTLWQFFRGLASSDKKMGAWYLTFHWYLPLSEHENWGFEAQQNWDVQEKLKKKVTLRQFFHGLASSAEKMGPLFVTFHWLEHEKNKVLKIR